MSVLDDVGRLVSENRLAHAYVIQGDPLAGGKQFAVDVLTLLFTGTTREAEDRVRHRIETRVHPDICWVEPASKLRQITVKALGDAQKRIGERSFEGGWKAVVFLGAERMNATVANKFLKTLEEPPERTLLLMVTQSPEQLLDTIRSRCQTLLAPRQAPPVPEWRDDLLTIMSEGPPRNLKARLVRAGVLKAFLESVSRDQQEEEGSDEGTEDEPVEDAVADARATAARRMLHRQVMAAVEDWYRDVLVARSGGDASLFCYPEQQEAIRAQAADLTEGALLKLLDNVREVARRMETNLPLQVALESAVI